MSKQIRLDHSVPVNYVEGSRDMQTLLRLLSMAANNTKLNAENIIYANNPMLINNRLLNLLCGKVGFFTRKQFKDDELRYTLDVFNYLVRNKGSRKSISEAIKLFFYINNITGDYVIDVNDQTREIGIYLGVELRDTSLLTEIFRYILPTGYYFNIYFYKDNKQMDSIQADIRYNLYSLIKLDNTRYSETRNAAYIYDYPEPVSLKTAQLNWKAYTDIDVSDYDIINASYIQTKVSDSLTIRNLNITNGILHIEVDKNVSLNDDLLIEYQIVSNSTQNTSGIADTNITRSQQLRVNCKWNWIGYIENKEITINTPDIDKQEQQNNLLEDLNSLRYKEDLLIKTAEGKIIRDFYLDDEKFEVHVEFPISIVLSRRNVVRSVDTTPIASEDE